MVSCIKGGEFVVKVKNIYYAVNNVDKMARFYEELFELELQFNDRNQWAQFKVNGFTFALAGPEEVPKGVNHGAIITFEVDDINETVERLKEKGLEVQPIRDMGTHGLTCSFQDPSGNIVQLFQKV